MNSISEVFLLEINKKAEKMKDHFRLFARACLTTYLAIMLVSLLRAERCLFVC